MSLVVELQLASFSQVVPVYYEDRQEVSMGRNILQVEPSQARERVQVYQSEYPDKRRVVVTVQEGERARVGIPAINTIFTIDLSDPTNPHFSVQDPAIGDKGVYSRRKWQPEFDTPNGSKPDRVTRRLVAGDTFSLIADSATGDMTVITREV